MTAVFSTEFWVVFQMLTILLLLGLLVYFIRHTRSGRSETHGVPESAGKVIELMEPLIREAESAARMFEEQILEKKDLIHSLNVKLESRIISLNLLLNRAEACLSRSINTLDDNRIPADKISDTQEAILDLFQKGLSPRAISDELSVSGQEVDLVISLKKKFIAMEKGSPR